MLKDLTQFTKSGYWLAVIEKKHQIKIVAISKKPEEALEKARKMGFKEASLMMSASRYAAWTS